MDLQNTQHPDFLDASIGMVNLMALTLSSIKFKICAIKLQIERRFKKSHTVLNKLMILCGTMSLTVQGRMSLVGYEVSVFHVFVDHFPSEFFLVLFAFNLFFKINFCNNFVLNMLFRIIFFNLLFDLSLFGWLFFSSKDFILFFYSLEIT